MFFNGSSGIERLLNTLGIGGGDVNSTVFAVSSVILGVALVLMTGFLMTRLTKLLKLPNVTAYIVAGILIGPSVFNLVPSRVINGTEFLSDIALAFIAFSAGEYFKVKDLKKNGGKVIVITLFESIAAFVLVFIIGKFALNIDTSFALVLAALASATAPASTIMTIRQTKAKGEYVNTLLQVVAFDDVVTLVLYSVAISVCIALNSGGNLDFATVGLPIIYNIVCLLIGGFLGFALKFLISKKRSNDNRLIIVIMILFLFCGICSLMGQSPLLGCMAIGAVYANTEKENSERLFKQVNYFAPPILLIFFVRSGMNFDLSAFASTSVVGGIPYALVLVAVVYFFTRIAGKYGGSYLGGVVTKSDKKIRNYLGLGLIPQAGVAIGLAAMGARTFANSGQAALGDALLTIILASSVLYELIGPGCAKLGLFLSKSYSRTENIEEVVPAAEVVKTLSDEEKHQNEVNILIAQIKHIKENIPDPPNMVEENEEAFTEAAEEYENDTINSFNRRFINRRK